MDSEARVLKLESCFRKFKERISKQKKKIRKLQRGFKNQDSKTASVSGRQGSLHHLLKEPGRRYIGPVLNPSYALRSKPSRVNPKPKTPKTPGLQPVSIEEGLSVSGPAM